MKRNSLISVLCCLTGKPGERLERMILEVVPRERLEIHRTFNSFSERLRKPTDEIPVAVILAAGEDDLLAVLSVSHLLYDVRFILILPDRDDPTVAIGHSLRPRFLSYRDGDFREVTAVLSKMIGGYYYQTKMTETLPRQTNFSGNMAARQPRFQKARLLKKAAVIELTAYERTCCPKEGLR